MDLGKNSVYGLDCLYKVAHCIQEQVPDNSGEINSVAHNADLKNLKNMIPMLSEFGITEQNIIGANNDELTKKLYRAALKKIIVDTHGKYDNSVITDELTDQLMSLSIIVTPRESDNTLSDSGVPRGVITPNRQWIKISFLELILLHYYNIYIDKAGAESDSIGSIWDIKSKAINLANEFSTNRLQATIVESFDDGSVETFEDLVGKHKKTGDFLNSDKMNFIHEMATVLGSNRGYGANKILLTAVQDANMTHKSFCPFLLGPVLEVDQSHGSKRSSPFKYDGQDFDITLLGSLLETCGLEYTVKGGIMHVSVKDKTDVLQQTSLIVLEKLLQLTQYEIYKENSLKNTSVPEQKYIKSRNIKEQIKATRSIDALKGIQHYFASMPLAAHLYEDEFFVGDDGTKEDKAKRMRDFCNVDTKNYKALDSIAFPSNLSKRILCEHKLCITSDKTEEEFKFNLEHELEKNKKHVESLQNKDQSTSKQGAIQKKGNDAADKKANDKDKIKKDKDRSFAQSPIPGPSKGIQYDSTTNLAAQQSTISTNSYSFSSGTGSVHSSVDVVDEGKCGCFNWCRWFFKRKKRTRVGPTVGQ